MNASTMVSASHSTQDKRGISGSTLKMIALLTMLIDHTGAVVLGRMITSRAFPEMQGQLYSIYYIMRLIGRVAFPIYCFLLVEGFTKTRSVGKYALRLAVFAVLSEFPFDMAFNGCILEFGYQNVFFTLLWGLLAMIVSDRLNRLWLGEQDTIPKKFLACMVTVMCAIVAMWAAERMNTDYGAIGVACIMALYLFKSWKVVQIVVGVIAFLWEVTAPLAFIPIGFYNGERGIQIKYLFYFFYPLHLLLLYGVCVLMRIHGYPAL